MQGIEIIESWLNENNYLFNKINAPEEFFHYITSVGLVKIPIEIYQKKDSPNISIGTRGIMTDSLLDVYVKLTDKDRENFIKKINELMNDFNMPYQIQHDEKRFVITTIVQIPFMSFNKNILIETIESVKNASEKSLGFGTKMLQEYREQYKSK